MYEKDDVGVILKQKTRKIKDDEEGLYPLD
jgi:hypothetical protein